MAAITELFPEELQAWCREQHEPAFRAKQILDWIYQKGVMDWEKMSNLSKGLREKLATGKRAQQYHVLETTVGDVLFGPGLFHRVHAVRRLHPQLCRPRHLPCDLLKQVIREGPLGQQQPFASFEAKEARRVAIHTDRDRYGSRSRDGTGFR